MLIGLGDDAWESEQASAWTPEAMAPLATPPPDNSFAAAWTRALAPFSLPSLSLAPLSLLSTTRTPGAAPSKTIMGMSAPVFAAVALALCGAGYYYTTRGRS